jgi:excisionase family DNA binding protein
MNRASNDAPERWYSMNEICAYLSITRDTVYTWVRDDGMPAVKIGRTWRFKPSEVDAWLRSHSELRRFGNAY